MMSTVAAGKSVRSVLQSPATVFDELLTHHPETGAHGKDVHKTLDSPRSVFEKLGGPLTEIPANKETQRKRNSFNPKDLIKALRSGEKALKTGEKGLQTWTLSPQMVQVRPAQKKATGTRKTNNSQKSGNTELVSVNENPIAAVAAQLASALTSPALAPFTVTSLFQSDLFGIANLEDVLSTAVDEAENLDPAQMYVNIPERGQSPSKRKRGVSMEMNKRSRSSLEGDRLDHAEVFQDFDVGIWWKIKNNKFIVVKFAMDSDAPKQGVRIGDILRAVDGVDILHCVADQEGHHLADDLLIGKEGSMCHLTFLRVAKRTLSHPRRNGTPLEEFQCSIRRGSVVHEDLTSVATGAVVNLE